MLQADIRQGRSHIGDHHQRRDASRAERRDPHLLLRPRRDRAQSATEHAALLVSVRRGLDEPALPSPGRVCELCARLHPSYAAERAWRIPELPQR